MENIKRGGMWLRPKGESVGVVVYIVVDNIESVLDKVTEQGGRIVTPKTPMALPFMHTSPIPAATCSDSGRRNALGNVASPDSVIDVLFAHPSAFPSHLKPSKKLTSPKRMGVDERSGGDLSSRHQYAACFMIPKLEL